MLWRRVIVLHAHAGEGHRHLRLADLLPPVLFYLVDGDDAPLDRRRERKYSEQHVARQLRAVLVLQKGVAGVGWQWPRLVHRPLPAIRIAAGLDAVLDKAEGAVAGFSLDH